MKKIKLKEKTFSPIEKPQKRILRSTDLGLD